MDTDEEEPGRAVGDEAAVGEGQGGVVGTGEGDLPSGAAELSGEGVGDFEGPFFFVLAVLADASGVGSAVTGVDEDIWIRGRRGRGGGDGRGFRGREGGCFSKRLRASVFEECGGFERAEDGGGREQHEQHRPEEGRGRAGLCARRHGAKIPENGKSLINFEITVFGKS